MSNTIYKHPITGEDLIRVKSEGSCYNCALKDGSKLNYHDRFKACDKRINMPCMKNVFGKTVWFNFKKAFES